VVALKVRPIDNSLCRHLIIIAGHSPDEEPLLVLRIDDPEFFDCCFQR